MRTLLLVLLGTLIAGSLQAQYKKILHQSFEIQDSVKTLDFKITGELEFEPWVGSALLIESYVTLHNGNATLFNYLEKTGRYLIEQEQADSTLVIKSKFEERLPIGTQMGESLEVVQVKVLLPDSFMPVDSVQWRRKEQ